MSSSGKIRLFTSGKEKGSNTSAVTVSPFQSRLQNLNAEALGIEFVCSCVFDL